MKLNGNRIAAALVAAVIAFSAAPARAQLVAYDGFGNGPLANLAGSTGGTGWTSAWANASDNLTKISGAGLSYAGLATTPGGAVTPTANGTWPSSIYQRAFGTLPAGTNSVYVSFLMRDDAAWGIWGGVSFGSYPYKMTVGSPLGMYSYGMTLSEGLGDVTNKPLIQGQTTFIVVRISKNTPAAGISYRMYINPAVGSAEPGFADAQYGVGPVSNLPTALSIDNGTGFTTDEIRVGTTWASVLPPLVSFWTDLGFAKPGIAGAPHLAGTGPLSANSSNQLALTSAKRSAPASLAFGLNTLNAPFKGGILVPEPTVVIPLVTSASGTLNLPFTWPSGVGAGVALKFQYWIQDAGATYGYSASNGLQGLTQ